MTTRCASIAPKDAIRIMFAAAVVAGDRVAHPTGADRPVTTDETADVLVTAVGAAAVDMAGMREVVDDPAATRRGAATAGTKIDGAVMADAMIGAVGMAAQALEGQVAVADDSVIVSDAMAVRRFHRRTLVRCHWRIRIGQS